VAMGLVIWGQRDEEEPPLNESEKIEITK